jgi:monoamine oxidase
MRVVVVGTGFAGLQAANDLRAAGHDVVVLEARDRVGGRVWSQELVYGDARTVIERGAEFVLEGYELLTAWVDRLGLQLADAGMTYYVREPRGAAPTSHEAMAEVAQRVAVAAAASPRSSVADVVAGLALDPAAAAAFVSRISVTSGLDADRVAAAVVSDVTSTFTPKATFRVAGGNQGIAIGLAQRLGDAVRLRSVVTGVRNVADGVRVTLADGGLDADAAVIAVPLPVLITLDVPDALATQRAAWERMGIGHNAKVHVPLNSVATTSAVQSVDGRFWTWTATDGSGEVQPVLHGFGGTPEGLAQLAAYDGPRTWAAAVAALRPELSLDLDAAVVTTWNDERFSGLSYTADVLGRHDGDDAVMGASFGAIHVAGEHTAGDWAGLMEGALRSGARAAAEITPPS